MPQTPSTQQQVSGRGGSYQDQTPQYMGASSGGNNNQSDYPQQNETENVTTGYQNMMGRGQMGGNFDYVSGFPANNMAPNMMGMGYPGQMPHNMDMSRMGQFGGFPGAMGMGGMGMANMGNMGGQMPHNQHDNTNNSQQDNNRNQNMMDMNQMQGMGGYGYGYPGQSQMMNFQGMTPEQQMQMMQFRGMQGGQMPGNMNQNQMNPGGN